MNDVIGQKIHIGDYVVMRNRTDSELIVAIILDAFEDDHLTEPYKLRVVSTKKYGIDRYRASSGSRITYPSRVCVVQNVPKDIVDVLQQAYAIYKEKK